MTNIIYSMLFFYGYIILMSCQKSLPENKAIINQLPPPKPVNIPHANAGLSQIIVLPTDSVLLNGNSSSDPDGKIISYSWSKISGPSSFYIVSPDSSKTIVNKLAEGVYQFELNVKDNHGLTGRNTVQITVNRALPTPPPPPPPPPPTPIPDSLGRVQFWTKLAVGDDYSSIVNISIGNQNKIINHYFGGDVLSCSESILIYINEGWFDLKPGVYNWKATYPIDNYTYSVSGLITINRGTCVLQEVIF